MHGTGQVTVLSRALAMAVLCSTACARILDQDPDTGLEAPLDSFDDTGIDTAGDSPVDPGVDAAEDTVVDTGPDAPIDTGYDVDSDTGYDTGDPDTGPVCPSGLSLATWGSGLDGWAPSHCAWARDAAGFMKYWSNIGTTCYEDSYDHTVTSGSAVDLSGCSSATLSYSVMLSDDMWTTDSDKSERLVAQCSPDGATGWTNLTPTSWPTNQSTCATSYCDGSTTLDRSFGWTSQSIAIPAACLTATAWFRFRAWGANNWRLNYWGVDTVRIN